MKKLYDPYPNFIPELKYSPEYYIKIHHTGWKKKLVSSFWYKIKFDDNGLIYTYYKKNKRKSYSYNLNMGYAASNYNSYLESEKKE